MANKSGRSLRLGILVWCLLCCLGVERSIAQCSNVASGTPTVAGVDHIPVAVSDLEQADQAYRRLGFTLKPGRFHQDGIRNEIVKFSDGTGVELITAPRATDALTAEYRRILQLGEGGAFVALRAPNLASLEHQLDVAGLEYKGEADGHVVTLPLGSRLHHLFFDERIPSRTDAPRYFRHPNTATSLIGVWIAPDDLAPERELFTRLGMSISREQTCTPQCETRLVWCFPSSTIVPLPASRQLVHGRPIIGAVLKVEDLDKAVSFVGKVVPSATTVVHAAQWDSVFVPPSATHGIWLELRQPHASAQSTAR